MAQRLSSVKPADISTAGGCHFDVPISNAEIALVRDAAAHCANRFQPDRAFLTDLASRWRAIVPSRHGERLVEAYVRMYPSLEGDGGIDSWAGSESKTVLADLVLTFPTEDERLCAVREALEVVARLMGKP